MATVCTILVQMTSNKINDLQTLPVYFTLRSGTLFDIVLNQPLMLTGIIRALVTLPISGFTLNP
jgi:hypothetical protein